MIKLLQLLKIINYFSIFYYYLPSLVKIPRVKNLKLSLLLLLLICELREDDCGTEHAREFYAHSFVCFNVFPMMHQCYIRNRMLNFGKDDST